MLTKGKKTMDFHILDSFILWEKCQTRPGPRPVCVPESSSGSALCLHFITK